MPTEGGYATRPHLFLPISLLVFFIKNDIVSQQNIHSGGLYHRRAEGGAVMAEQRVGEVMKFFSKPCVAAVKITDGEISIGDTIKFTGHTTDLTMALDSIEVNNQRVPRAIVGDYVGIKVADRVRPGDEVFKVTAS
jgi:putative protease